MFTSAIWLGHIFLWIERLEALGEQFDGGDITTRRIRMDIRPIAGTRLIREWHGVEHSVTVRADDYEWQGRPYKSLSSLPERSPGPGGTAGFSSALKTSASGAGDEPGQGRAIA